MEGSWLSPYRFPLALRSPSRSSPARNPRVSIMPPTPGVDYLTEAIEWSRASVAAAQPELVDLVERGSLVRIEKARFGPVPAWRSEFVEPEEIWIVGTSHVSKESAADVARVVMAVRPDSVVVELCQSRAGIMYTSYAAEETPVLKSSMFSLSGSKFFGAINRSMNLGGQSAFVLRLLLAVFSSKIFAGTKLRFGDEFRSAQKASEDVGAQIVLGDRPIEITLERAWSSMSWDEKLRLLASLFQGITRPSLEMSKPNLEGKDGDSNMLQLYEQLSISYPSLLQPLIHERDTSQTKFYPSCCKSKPSKLH